MSKLDELINKLCPQGVCFVMLADAFDEIKGMRGVTNKWKDEGNCRFIDYLNVYRHISVDVLDLPFATVQKLDQDTLKKGDILFTSASETPDECAIEAAIEKDIVNGIFLDDHLFGLRPNLSYGNRFITGFLKHYFRSESFRKDVLKAVRGVTRFYIAKPVFMKLTIPVPPIKVQCEIVRILDSFTELTAELTAELTTRKKQYEYYKDTLILNSGYPRVKLKEIATDCFRGACIKRDEVTEEGTPCIRYGEIYTSYGIFFDKCISHTNSSKIQSKKILKKNDILFAITGESIEDIAKSTAYIGDEEGLVGGDIVVLRHNQNAKYLSYALSTSDAVMQKGLGKVKSKVVHSNAPSILAIEIPLPSLEEQQRIVDILDNFNNLTMNMSIGIPSEINGRTKQYKYYRDKLLKFKELKA